MTQITDNEKREDNQWHISIAMKQQKKNITNCHPNCFCRMERL